MKLDTNGTNPEIIQNLIDTNLVDYVALDVKNSPEHYRETCGLQTKRSPALTSELGAAVSTKTEQACIASNHIASGSTASAKFTDAPLNASSLRTYTPVAEVEQTMQILFESRIPFELRTTVVKELHNEQSLINLANWISDVANKTPATAIPWFIQSFVDSETVLAGEGHYTPWAEEDLRALLPELQKVLPDTALRGI